MICASGATPGARVSAEHAHLHKRCRVFLRTGEEVCACPVCPAYLCRLQSYPVVANAGCRKSSPSSMTQIFTPVPCAVLPGLFQPDHLSDPVIILFIDTGSAGSSFLKTDFLLATSSGWQYVTSSSCKATTGVKCRGPTISAASQRRHWLQNPVSFFFCRVCNSRKSCMCCPLASLANLMNRFPV